MPFCLGMILLNSLFYDLNNLLCFQLIKIQTIYRHKLYNCTTLSVRNCAKENTWINWQYSWNVDHFCNVSYAVVRFTDGFWHGRTLAVNFCRQHRTDRCPTSHTAILSWVTKIYTHKSWKHQTGKMWFEMATCDRGEQWAAEKFQTNTTK